MQDSFEGIGARIERVEDQRLLTGGGRYVDDVSLPDMCHGVVVTSPHAHARIRSIDTSAAMQVPGVVCALTGADADADGLKGMPAFAYPKDWGGPDSYRTLWPILVKDRVRCVGDRVVFVVAETLRQARDASELVKVDYEPLPANADATIATQANTPLVWDDCAGNACFVLNEGDRSATDNAFANAAFSVKTYVRSQRISANAMEPRSAVGIYDKYDDRYTLWCSSQNPHAVRRMIAVFVMGISETRMRVISPDVGGGFGMKANAYPDDALVVWAAKRCERPVKWTATRGESLAGDNHARDHHAEGELALDKDGRILGLRVRTVHAIGAYFISAASSPPRTTGRMATSVYHVPNAVIENAAVFTNTSPMGVYRGAGRPEANLLIERLLEKAAGVTGIDRVEIRRRNLVTPEQMPYAPLKGVLGNVYDTGDFPGIFERCLQLSDWMGFETRRKDSDQKGFLRGRAISNYIEYSGVGNERMEVRIDANGDATILSGTHSHGQGHATAWAQIVSDRLGIPLRRIRFMQGDTDAVSFGRGTYAARSSLVGGCALALASDSIIDKGKRIAARLLDKSPDDIEHERGLFRIKGTNRSVNLDEVARAAFNMFLPKGETLGLEATGTWGSSPPAFPNGAHACELEIDPGTGVVRIDRYTSVDDIGEIINPLICEGQIIGGLAQGIGQALMEHMAYTPDGQLLSGSFMDYAMPRAGDMPPLTIDMACIASTTNPLGIKGVGETSVIASPAVILHAVIDALSAYGVEDIELPATPERILRAMGKLS